MDKRERRLWPQGGRRSVLYVVSGTVISQAVQFAVAPVLTRLFSPSEFGAYSSVLSVAFVLGALMVFSYPAAIPMAGNDDEGRALAWLSISLSVVVSAIAGLALCLAATRGISVLGYTVDIRVAIFVPLTSLAIALISTTQSWSVRANRFGRVGRAAANSAVAQAVTQIFAGVLAWGSAGLSLGFLVGRLFNSFTLVFRGGLGRPPTFQTMRDAARVHSLHPTWLMPAVVMNLLGTTAITPWVASQYGLQTAGAFALAVLVLSVPAGLVGQAVGTVLFPKFVELQRGTGVPPHALLRYVEALATLALAAFIPILMLGPALFALVFGESWRIAGIIASILTPWIATNFVSSPLSSLALVKGRFRRVFWVAMIETVARYGSIWAGGIADSATLGFALYSLAGVFICVASVAWILRLSGVDLIRTARCRALPTIGVIASIATLIFLRLTAPLPVLVAATLAVMTFACFRLVAQARS